MKEIGIRKTLGAGSLSIIRLLSGKFGVLILIGYVIACGVGYYGFKQWLQGFAYRVSPAMTDFCDNIFDDWDDCSSCRVFEDCSCTECESGNGVKTRLRSLFRVSSNLANIIKTKMYQRISRIYNRLLFNPTTYPLLATSKISLNSPNGSVIVPTCWSL